MRVTDEYIIQPYDRADLDDAGLPGYSAVTGIHADGDTLYVLACREVCGTDAPADRNWRVVAPHELPGPLPRQFKRLHGVLTCGRPARTTGRPCRNAVDHPGDACPWHATGGQNVIRI